MTSLAGQVALITGASSGIGEAIAWKFAEAGTKLVLIARRSERLSSLKSQLTEKFNAQVETVTLDMQDTPKLKQLPSALPDGFQQVDILVNNAGLALGKSGLQGTSLEDIETMVNTNVLAASLLVRLFCNGMLERNRGHIINISSIAAKQRYPGGGIYCGTKSYIDAFTEAIRHDFVNSQVKVTAVSPGAVQTEFSNVRYKGDDAAANATYEGMQPLLAADIADQVMYAATRPANVQIGEIVSFATTQASPWNVARPLADKSKA
ncbi:hypothetical protein WJX74_006337 [Apatococcus lobatus]|uniref:Uncharacterized protein n=2 Tax=Apatococcus TaxID=904362 RepID=A0AAW1SPM9_9CHLO